MFFFHIWHIPALIAAFLAFVLGVIWYHPNILGSQWLKERGKTLEDFNIGFPQYMVSFFLWCIASYFYAFLAMTMEINTPPEFFLLSCIVWVAFTMPPTVVGSLYTGYPFGAVAIDASYQLAGYYVFAVVHIAFSYFI